MRQLSFVVSVTLAGLVAAPSAWADESPVRQAHVATLEARLGLDAANAERMQALIEQYQGKMAPLQRQDVALLAELRTQLALTVPDARRMKSLAGSLVKNRQKLQALRDERLQKLQKTLTPEQFSRLLVRWPSLTRELRREARRAPHG